MRFSIDRHYSKYLFVAVAALCLGADGTTCRIRITPIPSPPPNEPPMAEAGTDQQVPSGAQVRLDGTASFDPEGGPLEFRWERVSGPAGISIQGRTGPVATFTAPTVSTAERLTIGLTITDDRGGIDTDFVVIAIDPPPPPPPTAMAGNDQTVDEGATVTLNGSGSRPVGVTLAWTQIGGSAVVISNPAIAQPTFSAPQVQTDTTFIFRLTARDAMSRESMDDVSVIVRDVPPPPMANAGPDEMVDEGATVQLNGAGSTGAGAAYRWTQTSGPTILFSDPNAVNPAFTAPMVNVTQTIILRLTLTDNRNRVSADDVTITIRDVPPPNRAPNVNAGQPQTVNETVTAMLDGSATTDPDGDVVTFMWQQVDGPVVTLTGANTSRPTFLTPSVAAATAFRFALTARDPAGLEATAEVTVTVADLDGGQIATVGLTPANIQLTFQQGQPPPAQFVVRNAGAGTLRYRISVSTADGGTWLGVAPTDGAASTETDTISVGISSSLPPGTFTGMITVTDPAALESPKSIGVTITVTP